jgi:lipopolysaccharide/colanic/teichoic acid biosynthesis glycosyltransferase
MTERDESLAERYARLASESPHRERDAALRGLDVGFSLLFSLVALPFALGVAAAILVTTGRPVFYRGERVGRAGRVFTMLKFRTLKPDAETRLGGYLGPELVERTRAEVTRLGRWLRATQLDEIPQLWNVLRGDMSLVGPRPEQIELVRRYRPEHRFRLAVKPGLTGPMQVFGRGQLSFEERLAVERDYIENLSISRDLRILALTIPSVFGGHGAY